MMTREYHKQNNFYRLVRRIRIGMRNRKEEIHKCDVSIETTTVPCIIIIMINTIVQNISQNTIRRFLIYN